MISKPNRRAEKTVDRLTALDDILSDGMLMFLPPLLLE